MSILKTFSFSVLTIILTNPLIAGTVRGGGDERIDRPLWECTNADNSLYVAVNQSGNQVQVKDAANNYVFASAYQDASAVLQPATVIDQNDQAFGTTIRWTQSESGKYVMALSVYLEKYAPGDTGSRRSPHFYQARVSVNWNGFKMKAEQLSCKRNLLAAHFDPVDSIVFE